MFSALPFTLSATAADATPPGAGDQLGGDQTPPVETPVLQESTAEPTSTTETETPLSTVAPALPTATSSSDEVSVAAPEVETADLFVQKYWCEDNTRAGDTDFLLDTPPDFSSSAVSTCNSHAPTGEDQVISITLLNLDTFGEYTQILDPSVTTSVYFFSIPVGNYVISEEVNGVVTTSDSFDITPGNTKRMRILNYVHETEHPSPEAEGYGEILGFDLTCTDPDRSGDVEFVINNGTTQASSVTACQVANVAGDLTLYRADGQNGPIDMESGVPVEQDPLGYNLSEIPNGYYALSFLAAGSSTPAVSDIFVVSNAMVIIEINVFAEVTSTTFMSVWKDICVDPSLAGHTRFFINTASNDVMPVSASASTECRDARESDGPFTITLTNTDTVEAQSGIILGSGDVLFEGLVSGTYTLTEAHEGQFATSDPFTIDPSQSYRTFIRN